MVDYFSIIHKYYTPSDLNYRILLMHSLLVASKALKIGKHRNKTYPDQKVDLQFIEEAAMLHDIGIYQTNSPEIGNFGDRSYMQHVVVGHKILLKEGLPKHARVALSHTGVGISKEKILDQNLDLDPTINYLPETIEEKIISYSDLFFSKVGNVFNEITPEEARKKQEQRGGEKEFDQRHKMFGY